MFCLLCFEFWAKIAFYARIFKKISRQRKDFAQQKKTGFFGKIRFFPISPVPALWLLRLPKYARECRTAGILQGFFIRKDFFSAIPSYKKSL